MNVIFFVPELVNCGPLNVVLGIVKSLTVEPDVSISIVSYRHSSRNDSFMEVLKSNGVSKFYSLSECSSFVEKLNYLKLIIKDTDIIHSHGFFPDFYSSILPFNYVKISTTHSILFKDYPATYGAIKGSAYALMHHLVYLNPSFNKIVGCSKAVESYLEKFLLFNRRKLLTVHNGVDQEKFYPVASEIKTNLKAKILDRKIDSVNPKSPIFTYSGRLTRLKKVPELISWFNALDNDVNLPNILIILGDGAELEACKNEAKTNKNILFMGFVDDVTPFYQISDYLVSFSAFEGFPMSVLEGISCGCKAILSDIPSHREVIKICPNLAILNKDFRQDNSDFFWSNDGIYYLSSDRMAKEYKSIYKCEL